MIRVVEAAAGNVWMAPEPGQSARGRGAGMVCLDYLGIYVAAMAQIRVEKTSGRSVSTASSHAQDMGPVQSAGSRMQIEGAITMDWATA